MLVYREGRRIFFFCVFVSCCWEKLRETARVSWDTVPTELIDMTLCFFLNRENTSQNDQTYFSDDYKRN